MLFRTAIGTLTLKKIPLWLIDLIFSLFFGLALGAALAAFCPGTYWQSWSSAGILSILFSFLLLRLWRFLGSSKRLFVLLLATFLLRIVIGTVIHQVLPLAGYADSEVQQAGYLYSDAYERNQAAYTLAVSGEPLLNAFSRPDISDQYGGLLFMSAFIYRVLSPDIIRPLLIALMAAFAMAVGTGFLWSGIQVHWSQKVALIACWIYALYPDSLLLGSSEMREPFLIALACIIFWAIMKWREKPALYLSIAVLASAVCCLFSIPAGMIYVALMTSILILDWTLTQKKKAFRWFGFIFLAIVACAAAAGGWMWLKNTLYFDAYTTRISSGWITDLMSKYGEKWTIPFVTIYGVTQPVLPAAIFEPSIPFWVIVAILRGLGWYCVIPLLLFGFFAALKTGKDQSRWLLLLLFVFFFIWTVVSSARAGGDQWDNPRYRFMLLPFMCLVIGWTIENYQKTHSPWLWRWVLVVAEFVLFFINFYANRYISPVETQIPFPKMIGLIILVAVVILFGGWLWDILQARLKKERVDHG